MIIMIITSHTGVSVGRPGDVEAGLGAVNQQVSPHTEITTII